MVNLANILEHWLRVRGGSPTHWGGAWTPSLPSRVTGREWSRLWCTCMGSDWSEASLKPLEGRVRLQLLSLGKEWSQVGSWTDVVVHAGLKLPVHRGYLLTTLFLQPEPLHVRDDICGLERPPPAPLLPASPPLLLAPPTYCGGTLHYILWAGPQLASPPPPPPPPSLPLLSPHDDRGGAFSHLETYRLQQVGWWGEEVARTAAGVPCSPR